MPEMPVESDRLWSMKEVARYLGFSRRTVERLRSAGQFPRPQINRPRMLRWKPETIRQWKGARV
jgi:predicted DNA-binding transcriptional regulator AlpA